MSDTVAVIPGAPRGGGVLACFAGILFTLITRIRDWFYVLRGNGEKFFLHTAPGCQLIAHQCRAPLVRRAWGWDQAHCVSSGRLAPLSVPSCVK